MATGRGKWIWSTYVLLAMVFVVSAAAYGPLGLIVGALATGLAAERVIVLWRSRRRVIASAIAVWLGVGVAAMLLPIWGHPGFSHADGRVVVSRHSHYLWENDHIH